jgi:aspartyl-tRNA(Asn)/glutamyl-tRNA(Gln) amidotransferase subunit B
MRTKEDAQDYRYFPDPDLLPLEIKESWIDDIKKTLPELPYAKMKRFTGQLGLPEYDSQILSFEKDMADFFEEVVKHSHNSKAAANWLMTDLTRELNSQGISIKHSPILPVNLGKMIKLIDQGSITGKIAKTVFQEMWKTQEAPEAVLQRLGLVQISDKNALESMVEKILGDNPSQVKDYQSGKTKLLGFFVGAVMKASKGQANPDLVNKILTEKLKKI